MDKYILKDGSASVEGATSPLAEKEYTIPLSKHEIKAALMVSLDENLEQQVEIDKLEDNIKKQQAEIEHLELALEKNRTYWKKEVDNLQAEVDVLRKHQERLRKWVADGQDEIAELVNMLLYCNPVPAKKTQYEALMDKHNDK